MADTRKLIGGRPVIGIRPTIDGRVGPLDVRGSLEEQTMGMALKAKKLYEENLRYSDGTPVKVVIADSTIGRVRESAACAQKFKREGVDITLTVTPCWCYGSETMDQDPTTIKGVWGLNATERPGAVYLASVLATNILVSNINGASADKYVFICNDFDKEEDNALISPNVALKFSVSDYIDHFNHYANMKPDDLSKESSIQKAAFLII